MSNNIYLSTTEEFKSAIAATENGKPMLVNFSSAMVKDSLRFDGIFLGQI